MAKVIKRNTMDTAPGLEALGLDTDVRRSPVIDKSTLDARSDAQGIRERAESDAQKLIEKAELEAAAIRDKAHDEGYSLGQSRGAAELTALCTEASARLKAIDEQAIPELKKLAIGVARKIIGRELETRPDAIVDLVKHALSQKARQRKEISLRVHPKDIAILKENKASLLEVISRTTDVSIQEDPTVGRHGVVIETEAGTIDAQLETQVEALERVLTKDC